MYVHTMYIFTDIISKTIAVRYQPVFTWETLQFTASTTSTAGIITRLTIPHTELSEVSGRTCLVYDTTMWIRHHVSLLTRQAVILRSSITYLTIWITTKKCERTIIRKYHSHSDTLHEEKFKGIIICASENCGNIHILIIVWQHGIENSLWKVRGYWYWVISLHWLHLNINAQLIHQHISDNIFR